MRASNRKRPPRPLAARRWLPLAFALGLALLGGPDARAEVPPAPDPATVAAGRELFHREWMPMDPRSHGGDGLGPAYNESSCVACHSLGGPGGAGPASRNVDLLSLELGSALGRGAIFDGAPPRGPVNGQFRGSTGFVEREALSRFDINFSSLSATGASPVGDSLLSRFSREMTRIRGSASALKDVFAVHPGFQENRTVTLHRFGTDSSYAQWQAEWVALANRVSMPASRGGSRPVRSIILQNSQTITTVSGRMNPALGRVDSSDLRQEIVARVPSLGNSRVFDGATVVRSERNTTPLFGLGLIDAIPDAVIEAEATRQADQTIPTAGRVSRVKGGRVGRLGWKGQTAHLADFVLDACATEVGLEVPGRSQGALPNMPAKAATGLDLTADECNALTTFVAALPRPEQRPSRGVEAEAIAAGRTQFAAVGCADCHVPDLGKVAGLYSDLLLHDMGTATASSGSYGGSSGEGDSDEMSNPSLVAQRLGPVERGPAPRANQGASKGEWRTPPLWGVRDSAPYLHDGRAQTLEQAIALHGGQADASARRYFNLPAEERVRVEAFLRSLVAPTSSEPLAMR